MTDIRRIVLSDDHPIVLAGLSKLIEAEEDLQVAGRASTGLEALKLIRELRPDLAIADISMPTLTGIGLMRCLAEQELSVPVLILSLHDDRAHVSQAMQAGACGYMLKRSAVDNLVVAIRAVLSGGIYIDPMLAGRLFKPKTGGAGSFGMFAPELTERETEVLKSAAVGFLNKEIAQQLDVGVKSVETYKARGCEKLGIKSRVELVRYALVQGWLSHD